MAEAQGMVQKTGAHLWITHVLMITGVLVIFFQFGWPLLHLL